MYSGKLVIFEGVPGSGKTTAAGMLHDHLSKSGVDSKLFLEGCDHPVDLTFHAYLTLDQYRALLTIYPDQAAWFKKHSIVESNYVLTPYMKPALDPYNEMAFEYLRENEFCYSSSPVVQFSAFQKVFARRFERFATNALANRSITVFESVLFQHQIHDIKRMYPDVADQEIVDYICSLAKILLPLNPVLFYLSQGDIRTHLHRTAAIRTQPKWSSAEMVAYYIKRQNLELNIIQSLPIPSFTIDNTAFELEKVFNTVLSRISSENTGVSTFADTER